MLGKSISAVLAGEHKITELLAIEKQGFEAIFSSIMAITADDQYGAVGQGNKLSYHLVSEVS